MRKRAPVTRPSDAAGNHPKGSERACPALLPSAVRNRTQEPLRSAGPSGRPGSMEYAPPGLSGRGQSPSVCRTSRFFRARSVAPRRRHPRHGCRPPTGLPLQSTRGFAPSMPGEYSSRSCWPRYSLATAPVKPGTYSVSASSIAYACSSDLLPESGIVSFSAIVHSSLCDEFNSWPGITPDNASSATPNPSYACSLATVCRYNYHYWIVRPSPIRSDEVGLDRAAGPRTVRQACRHPNCHRSVARCT